MVIHPPYSTIRRKLVHVFAYHWIPGVDIGIGAALTNSYGMPLLLPVGYLKWNKQGRYFIDVSMMNGMKLSGGINISDAFRLKFTALEMDGMSAVIDYEGSTRLYTTVMMRSYVQMEYHFARKSWLSVGTGSNFLRSSSIRKRKIGSLLEHRNEDEKRRFKPSLLLNATLHVGL